MFAAEKSCSLPISGTRLYDILLRCCIEANVQPEIQNGKVVTTIPHGMCCTRQAAGYGVRLVARIFLVVTIDLLIAPQIQLLAPPACRCFLSYASSLCEQSSHRCNAVMVTWYSS